MSKIELNSLDDLISEREVYNRWGHLFANEELRQARQAKELECFDLRKGIFYTQTQLLGYLETRRRARCQNRPLLDPSDQPAASGNFRTNGLGEKPIRLTSTDTSTQEMGDVVAKALERKT